ncbi:MAG: DUF4062 domain-containing protein, partial [Bacteroidota bacterium]
MNFFNHLFGKKNKTRVPAEPASQQEKQPAKEIPASENAMEPESLAQSKPEPNPAAKNTMPPASKPSRQEQTADDRQISETTPWRTFAIFISSTFADMQAERDYLKHVVIPKVEEKLQEKRIKLEIVDLRWGVDTTSIAQEDEREANVLKVCLDEIKRCRPFFIGLLGDRYGWVPPEERMKAALAGESNILLEKGKSVTDLEIEFGVLASNDQLVRSVFYFRDPLPYEKFSEKKAALFSDEYNKDLSEAEKKERKYSLEKLKAKIVLRFEIINQKDKVKTYSGTWDPATETVTGLETWGETVYTDILAECKSHAADTWDKAPKNWQEQEMALLDAFIENNITTFCGRKPLLETLKQHLLSDDNANWGLALTGESGSGKSAVFSMIVKELQQENCFVLAHSAGISPRAKNVGDLLQIWNRQLNEFLGMNEEEGSHLPIPIGEGPGVRFSEASANTIEKLQEKFLELLQLASAKTRVVLLIDALDRFEPTARAQHLSWLPSLMPRNVRLLFTAITGIEQKTVKYHSGLRVRSIDVFSTAEAKEMLLALCKRQHKTLPAKVVTVILDKIRDDGQPATSSPLWLSLAVNMLMALDHDDFEKMSHLEGQGGQQIESYMVNLALGFDKLPGPLFLDLVNKAGAVFGETFTKAVFNFIAASRNGLREKDLEKILPAINIGWDPLQFVGLRRWFKAHLILQGEELQWNLAHSILKSTLLEKMTEPARKKAYVEVASHLLSLPDTDALKISETIYYLMHADSREMAANYYGSYWWDTQQTECSSKVMAEEVITDETKGKSDWMDWLVSLPRYGDNEKLNPRTISYNFIFSLFDKHFQNDITIKTRIRLVQSAEARMEELRHRAPDSADYARDLSVSFEKLGDLYLKLGDPPKALDKYQASLAIAEELRHRAPDSADYARDLSVSFEKLGDLYLKLGDPPKALDK